jgi:Sap, sulfolipid-1-addressing protein
MADILPLALAAAVYPVLLAGVIVILARPDPRRQLVAFLAGGMTISVALGLVLLAVADASGGFERSSQPASPAVDFVCGAITLALGVGVATGHPRRLAALGAARPSRPPDQPSRAGRVLARDSWTLTAAVGALLNLPGIWYLAALKQIATGGHGTGTELALVLAFNAIMFLLVEIPLVGYLVSPDRTRAAVDGFNGWVRDHRREAIAAVAGMVGIYLMVKGLAEALP